jgi:hypothetical protein
MPDFRILSKSLFVRGSVLLNTLRISSLMSCLSWDIFSFYLRINIFVCNFYVCVWGH